MSELQEDLEFASKNPVEVLYARSAMKNAINQGKESGSDFSDPVYREQVVRNAMDRTVQIFKRRHKIETGNEPDDQTMEAFLSSAKGVGLLTEKMIRGSLERVGEDGKGPVLGSSDFFRRLNEQLEAIPKEPTYEAVLKAGFQDSTALSVNFAKKFTEDTFNSTVWNKAPDEEFEYSKHIIEFPGDAEIMLANISIIDERVKTYKDFTQLLGDTVNKRIVAEYYARSGAGLGTELLAEGSAVLGEAVAFGAAGAAVGGPYGFLGAAIGGVVHEGAMAVSRHQRDMTMSLDDSVRNFAFGATIEALTLGTATGLKQVLKKGKGSADQLLGLPAPLKDINAPVERGLELPAPLRKFELEPESFLTRQAEITSARQSAIGKEFFDLDNIDETFTVSRSGSRESTVDSFAKDLKAANSVKDFDEINALIDNMPSSPEKQKMIRATTKAREEFDLSDLDGSFVSELKQAESFEDFESMKEVIDRLPESPTKSFLLLKANQVQLSRGLMEKF